MFYYNASDVRKHTCKLLELVDDGVIDAKEALQAALCYMSEDEVADMCRVNDFFFEEEDEE